MTAYADAAARDSSRVSNPLAPAGCGVRVPVRDERHGLAITWLVRQPDWAALLGPGAAIRIYSR